MSRMRDINGAPDKAHLIPTKYCDSRSWPRLRADNHSNQRHEGISMELPWYRVHTVVLNDPGQWNLYAQNPDFENHLFGTSQGAGTAILTLLGGFHPQTQSLWLTDIAHHHLVVAFIFLVVGRMYKTNFGIGYNMKDLLEAHIPLGVNWGVDIRSLCTINNSIPFQLGLALASLGVITSLVAQHMYSLPAYTFIAQDFTTRVLLYTHHQYIAGFIMIRAFAHGAIFFIRDYIQERNEDNVLVRMLDRKEAIISHLSWAKLFMGFHTLGLYVHNDVMFAFGTPEKQILIEPIFAQWIQSAHGKTSYGFDVLLSSTTGPTFNAGRSVWLPDWLNAVNENSNSLFLTIGLGDFLVHHVITLGLHTTTLILVKGVLDVRGSKLMPDKKDFGYSFPCDGPGRDDTCEAWDAFYLTSPPFFSLYLDLTTLYLISLDLIIALSPSPCLTTTFDLITVSYWVAAASASLCCPSVRPSLVFLEPPGPVLLFRCRISRAYR
ncbi:hypothetical protein Syun_011814 [Stephania yunnanensis]|uniref:Photosystem I n=1 Tax=Stephania yunnanensis TaxID=152371 RepID=A0AAP0JZ04_9MAGN